MAERSSASSDGVNVPRREQVNRTGFPFQIAVAEELRRTQSRHGWTVLASEVPWASGFIDLVIAREDCLAVLECKRALDDQDPQEWIFLAESGRPGVTAAARVEANSLAEQDRWGKTREQVEAMIIAGDVNFEPMSPQAGFCAYPKRGGPGGSLEEVSRDLVAAAHDILCEPSRGGSPAVVPVLPIIVTTARLFCCAFDPKSTLLVDGRVAADEFSEEPFVRFRKSLVNYDTRHPSESPLMIQEWVIERERTVMIVNAGSLVSFLRAVNFKPCAKETSGVGSKRKAKR
jgi:hypothetical protein